MRRLVVAGSLVGLLGCGDLASAVSGSCHGSQTVASMQVVICTESPTLSVDQQGTLNTLCRSGQLGSTANDWRMGEACSRTGRVGGCQRTVQGINVISWVYPSTTAVDATGARAFCASLGATYVAP